MRGVSSRTHFILAGLTLSLSGGLAQAHDSKDAWRLFVGDHAEGVVRAIDLNDGTSAGEFKIDKTPALSRSESGRAVFAVQGDAGKVAVISTGIAFDDHGDHADLRVEDAKLLPTTISGKKPAHFVESGGTIALFDDGTGDVALFPESQVLDAGYKPRTLKTGAAHHGLAAPFGAFTIHSVPNPEDASKRPVGLKVVDAKGEQVGDVTACPGLHGQAPSGGAFAFGCHDGIVVARQGDGAPKLTHISTADLGEGNVSTLKGAKAMSYFLGNYGQRAVVVIEPDAEKPFRKVDLPSRRVDFALDPAHPEHAYILTEDGSLHRLNIVSGKIDKSLQVTEAYSMDGHWRDPRPRIALAGEHLALTDPRKGVVRVVDLEDFKLDREIAVAGVPYTIVAVGGSGAVH